MKYKFLSDSITEKVHSFHTTANHVPAFSGNTEN